MKFKKLIIIILISTKISSAGDKPLREIERIPSYDGHPFVFYSNLRHALRGKCPAVIIANVNSYKATHPTVGRYGEHVGRKYQINGKPVDARTFFFNAPANYIRRFINGVHLTSEPELADPELIRILTLREEHQDTVATIGTPYANEINGRNYWDERAKLIKEGEIKKSSCAIL